MSDWQRGPGPLCVRCTIVTMIVTFYLLMIMIILNISLYHHTALQRNLRPGIYHSHLGLPLLKGQLGPSYGGPVSLLEPRQGGCQTLPPALPAPPRPSGLSLQSYRLQIPAACSCQGVRIQGLRRAGVMLGRGLLTLMFVTRYFPESISVSVHLSGTGSLH